MIDHLTQHPIMSCKRLLSGLVQDRAETRPQHIFAKVPRNNDYANGYRTVTNSTLMTAVDHVAGLITSTFGPGKDFQRIAYLGLHDLRYTIVVLAGIKTGYTMFLPSPRNSEEAHAALLSSLECSKLITTWPAPVGVAFVQSVTSEKLTIPTLDELLDLNPECVPAVTYKKSFEDAKTDPIFILHTSGSTGIPKPLIYTNEYVSRMYNVQDLVPPVDFDSVNEKLRTGSCLVMLPPFHIAGLAFTLLLPALNGNIPVYPTAGAPPGLNVFLGALAVEQAEKIDWAFLSPAGVDEIGKDPSVLHDVAEKLKYLFYTGGSVPKASGTAIAKKMDLYQVLGSSECAAFPLLRHQNGDRMEDWQYICVHPKAKVEFRHRYDDYHEMVQTRDVSAEGERYQPVFCHFNTLDAYETKDLFTKHPTSPKTYIHVGRTDDIIVFSNGEKTNPASFQDEVARHPEIRAALVVGQQRQEAALLVEPTDRQILSEQAKQELVERIWPTVEECNSRCPKHAKVSKTKILIAPASAPFFRAGKGTVQRQSTLVAFKPRIDSLYDEDNEQGTSWMPDAHVEPLAIEDVMAAVSRGLVIVKCNVNSPTSDFFANGMDSLQAIQLRRELKRKFEFVGTDNMLLYANPTIHTLANSIVEASLGNTAGDLRVDDFESTLQLYLSKINDMREGKPASLEELTRGRIEEPTSGFQDRSSLNVPKPPVKEAILLTGSTGALGSHILNTLLEREGREERMVYCLNRPPNSHDPQVGQPPDSRDRQICHNKARGLPIDFLEDRVRFFTGDPALPQFGLGDEEFGELQRSVTHIMHNAWPVDFNMSLQSFTGCLDGIIGLIRFADRSRYQVTLQLVSSIAAVAASRERPVVIEEALTDAQIPVSMGYGRSKHLAEKLLTHASQKLGISTIAVRVGQISGDSSRKRGWNLREWFPSLVVSSLHIRALPRTLGCAEDEKEVKWVPVDSTAKILLELAAVPAHSGSNDTFHVEHPRPIAWSELFPVILGALDKATSERGGPQMEVLDYREWFKRLEATFSVDSTVTEALSANPAVKLLSFFESLLSKEDVTAIFDVSRSIASSSTMQSLEPVTSDCLEAWVNGWIHGDEI
jgi:thioester reductase-like protein/acyl-coenzyme A synthetase/AMP-(fatty) acid ligase